ncbi:MAG: ASCH domain-containing protein [Gemmobacter sp.]|nr:ASCH domain-containing protein [Gemmobacter sp.]
MTDLPADIATRSPGAVTFRFGDDARLNAHILDLVRSGQKTLTCGALASFAASEAPLPEPGRTDIAPDWDGQPVLAIQAVTVEIISFDQMDAARVPAQGEFRDLDDRRAGDERHLRRTGHFVPNAPMLVETFRVAEVFAP